MAAATCSGAPRSTCSTWTGGTPGGGVQQVVGHLHRGKVSQSRRRNRNVQDYTYIVQILNFPKNYARRVPGGRSGRDFEGGGLWAANIPGDMVAQYTAALEPGGEALDSFGIGFR